MATNRRVHAECVNASNPFHECTAACLVKIAEGQGKKLNKKKSGSFVLSGSLSFSKKKKKAESQPVSPLVVSETVSPRSPLTNRKKAGSENVRPFSSPKKNSDGSYSHERSPNKKQVQSSVSMPANIKKNSDEMYSHDHPSNKEQVGSLESTPMTAKTEPNRPQSPSKGSFIDFATKTPTKEIENEELPASPKEPKQYVDKNGSEEYSAQLVPDFSFLGLSPLADRDDEEIQSVISDSCVSVGKYHIKASMAPILQSIFDKYGDIAANCQLQSASMRTHYLECLCSVVHELQSNALEQLSNSKIKEMLAVLKDVESVQMDVTWLREILNELGQASELISQQASYERLTGKTKKELETALEDLSRKEKEVSDAKAYVAELRSRLKDLELKSSQCSNGATSLKSKIDKLRQKSSVDEIL